MASTIRQRRTFGFSDDGDGTTEANLVLDPQEQEEVIDNLREAAKYSNEKSARAIAAILAVGVSLQLYFLTMLVQGSQSTPLTPILDSALEAKPLIPLASLFTILHIAVHVLDIISLIPELSGLHKSVSEDFWMSRGFLRVSWSLVETYKHAMVTSCETKKIVRIYLAR
ncbi:hypothetical protein RSAG8_04952, partial [Rhizoctonia solani AG-8 WAC10335]